MYFCSFEAKSKQKMKLVLSLSLILNIVFMGCFSYAGVIPSGNRTPNSLIEHSISPSISKPKEKKIFLSFNRHLLKKPKLRKKTVDRFFGKMISILLFVIPSLIMYFVGFAFMFSTLKTGALVYFTGWLWILIAGAWVLLGGFVAGKKWKKGYAVIFHFSPAIVLGVFAIVQLFSIPFGGAAANLLLSILTLILGFIIGSLGFLLGGD